LNTVSCVDGSSFTSKSTSMCLLATQKTAPVTESAEGTVPALFFWDVVRCHSILCHFVSGTKWWNQLLSSVMMLNRSITLSSMLP